MRIISILIFSIILLLASASSVLADGGGADSEAKEVDGYMVALAFIEGDARVGNNKISVEIEDAQGEAVDNARVKVIAELYAETSEHSDKDTGGMDMGETSTPEEDTSAEEPIHTVTADMEAGHNMGEYEGELELEEDGHWMVKVVFLVGSQERVAEFTVDISGTPSGWAILLPFLGINAVVITVAAIIKIKRSKIPAAEGTK